MFGIFKKHQKLTSSVIDDIKYNKKFEEYEGKAYVKSFNLTLEVTFKTSIDYAEKCINSLSEEIYDKIRDSLINLCNEEVEDYLDDEIYSSLYKLNKNQIMNHVSDLSIIIDESREDQIGYCISGNCEWNEEHGFIIVICDNKIKYVGEHDNLYSPWDKYKN